MPSATMDVPSPVHRNPDGVAPTIPHWVKASVRNAGMEQSRERKSVMTEILPQVTDALPASLIPAGLAPESPLSAKNAAMECRRMQKHVMTEILQMETGATTVVPSKQIGPVQVSHQSVRSAEMGNLKGRKPVMTEIPLIAMAVPASASWKVVGCVHTAIH